MEIVFTIMAIASGFYYFGKQLYPLMAGRKQWQALADSYGLQLTPGHLWKSHRLSGTLKDGTAVLATVGLQKVSEPETAYLQLQLRPHHMPRSLIVYRSKRWLQTKQSRPQLKDIAHTPHRNNPDTLPSDPKVVEVLISLFTTSTLEQVENGFLRFRLPLRLESLEADLEEQLAHGRRLVEVLHAERAATHHPSTT